MSTSQTALATRYDGTKLPSAGTVINETVADFTANMGPYILAGLGMMCVQVPLVLVALVVLYGGMFTLMFGGILVSAGLAAAVDDDLGALLAGVGQLGTFGLVFAFLFAMVGLLGAITAPLSASLWREVAAHQRGEGELGFASAFRQAGQDVVPVMMVTFAILAAVFTGLIFCYLPGFIAGFALSYAAPLVYLHRQGAFAALRMSVSKIFAHPAEHVVFGLMNFALALVANYVPILGMMFMVALHVRLYRHLFGDGDEPVVG
jgi:hypothetical protein